MRITREEIIKDATALIDNQEQTKEMLMQVLQETELLAKCFLVLDEPGVEQYFVMPFEKAPELLRDLCNFSGGDEDWMVIASKEPQFMPGWIEHLDSNYDPDVYILDGVVIYVGSHG